MQKRLTSGAQSATNSKAASAELAPAVRRAVEAAETATRESEIVPAFPADRMPSEQEAKMSGYASAKEWYVDVRMKRDKAPKLFTKPIEGTEQPPAHNTLGTCYAHHTQKRNRAMNITTSSTQHFGEKSCTAYTKT